MNARTIGGVVLIGAAAYLVWSAMQRKQRDRAAAVDIAERFNDELAAPTSRALAGLRAPLRPVGEPALQGIVGPAYPSEDATAN